MALPLGFRGATSTFYRIEPGLVLKSPRESKVFPAAEIEQSFSVERQILEILGSHCRIVGYLGWKEDSPRGLKLAEASHGSLQQYLYDNPVIPSSLREKWCRQAVSAVAFVHSKGVIHSDLRPANFLIHATTATSLDLWLCDFGTSECKQYGLNEGRLPHTGFYDPCLAPQPGKAMDIFSLASVLYAILTGHWPHRDPGRFQTIEQVDAYEEKVERLFALGEFPDVGGLFMGEVIMNCWEHKYWDMKDVERDLS